MQLLMVADSNLGGVDCGFCVLVFRVGGSCSSSLDEESKELLSEADLKNFDLRIVLGISFWGGLVCVFKGCSVSSCGADIGESCVGCSVLMLLCVILVLCWLSELSDSVVVETLVSILLMY